MPADLREAIAAEPRAQAMFDNASWRPNMYRVANYEKLRQADNLDLAGCIQTGAAASDMWPGSGFTTGSLGKRQQEGARLLSPAAVARQEPRKPLGTDLACGDT